MDKYFGKKAKDKITGFTGTITGKIEWMYGCNQYCIVPPVSKEGKLDGGEWFDEGRVEILESCIDPDSVKVEKNGADYANMPRAY